MRAKPYVVERERGEFWVMLTPKTPLIGPLESLDAAFKEWRIHYSHPNWRYQ